MTDRLALSERVRAACLQAALDADERAGIAGLCGEGRWELAVQAIRTLDLAALVEKVGDTFGHVLRRLCRGHVERIRAGLVGWRFEDPREIVGQTMRLFDSMNGLYDRLGLPEEIDERVSKEIARLLECSLQ